MSTSAPEKEPSALFDFTHLSFAEIEQISLSAMWQMNKPNRMHRLIHSHAQFNIWNTFRWFFIASYKINAAHTVKTFWIHEYKARILCSPLARFYVSVIHSTNTYIYTKLFHKLHSFPHIIEIAATFHENVISTDFNSFHFFFLFRFSFFIPVVEFLALCVWLACYFCTMSCMNLWRQNHNERSEFICNLM